MWGLMAPLNRMFPFITKTWSPIAGGVNVNDDKIYACPFRCSYCWANQLINKFPKGNLGKKYSGSYRIHKPAIKEWISPDDFIFVQCMSDIGAPDIPHKIILEVLNFIRKKTSVSFLLMTKNPEFYTRYDLWIPHNCVLGVTIETDIKRHTSKFSKAPTPQDRIEHMKYATIHHDTFISIEPIMDFSPLFANSLSYIRPWGVAVGYDNYNNNLPEPELSKTLKLISDLGKYTTVYKKSIRERRIN